MKTKHRWRRAGSDFLTGSAATTSLRSGERYRGPGALVSWGFADGQVSVFWLVDAWTPDKEKGLSVRYETREQAQAAAEKWLDKQAARGQ